jgi:hypothetical protein
MLPLSQGEAVLRPPSPKHGFGLLERKRGLRTPKTRSGARVSYMSQNLIF